MSEPARFREVVFDKLRSGLATDAMFEGDPPSLRVTWIAWDSGFRGSGLRVGDRIVAIEGVALVRPQDTPSLQRAVRELPGGLNEHGAFAARGLNDGAALRLTVRRRRVPGDGWMTIDVSGRVLLERTYADAQGRRALGPTGPESLVKDGFDSSWAAWYEKRVSEWRTVLDDGWTRVRLNTQVKLKAHLEDSARIDFLGAHCAGPFADAARADFDAVTSSLRGTRYELGAEALDYRELEEERVRRVRAAAERAWESYLADHAGEIIPAFPAVNPLHEDHSHLVGKLVVLPRIEPRQWLASVDVHYLATQRDGHWYFAAVAAPAMRRVFDAMYRYRQFVGPKISETVALVGRIMPAPRIMVADRRSAAGLEVEPVAALVDGAMFVEPEVETDGESPFAGEGELRKQLSAMPPDDAPPREVMQAFVAALKAGDQTTWNALFCDWNHVPGAGTPLYHAFYPYSRANASEEWIRARRLVLDAVHDIRVVWVSDPATVLSGDEFFGAPHLEEVHVVLDHVGCFDGEYRAFNSVSVHRIWALQRRDAGPWRIATRQGI